MSARSAADIQHDSWRRWHKTHEKLASAFTFKLAASRVQPICFIPGCVVIDDFFVPRL
jgi:hypothetical protein